MSSRLFVPSTDNHKLQKAKLIDCSGIILDLEDAVESEQKAYARDQAVNTLLHNRPSTQQTAVRINGLDSSWWSEDLWEIIPARPDVIVIPKVEDITDVHRLDDELSRIEQQSGLALGSTRIEPILETSKGIFNMESILAASERIVTATMGMADLCKDLGISWETAFMESPSLFLAERTRLAIVCRALGLQAPWDSVYMNFQDTEGLKRDTELGHRLGFQGKYVIHPSQIYVVNDVYRITSQEIEKARRILAAYDKAAKQGNGAVQIDGLLIDKPVVIRAKSILRRAQMED